MIFLITAVTLLILPSSAYAMAYIMLMDPGFIFFAFIKTPIIISFCGAICEMLFISHVRKKEGATSSFFLFFIGNAAGMAATTILFTFLIFIVSSQLQDGPMWLSWFAYWYFAFTHAYVLVTTKRTIINKFARNTEASAINKQLWVSSLLISGCFYTYVYFEIFYEM